MAGLSTQELLAILARAELPGAKVASVAEVVENAQLRHRNQIVTLDHPTSGAVPMHGVNIRLSDAPGVVERAPPTLGQHTDEVLREWLGLAPQEIVALRAAGTI